MLDQPFWAERVRAIGIGHGPVRASDLAGPNVGQAVDRILADAAVARRVREVRDALADPARAAEVDAAISDIFGVP